MAKIEIFTTSSCPFCFAAKNLLDKKKAPYEETEVSDPVKRAAMIERTKGRRSVPQIFIDDFHVGGFDDLVELDRAGKLDPLLVQ
ncbi:MAG: glutaredoxin 3 [Devosiaceae bacterium]|nr:glutaredoxin 3 [Devosiaceae bacterium]